MTGRGVFKHTPGLGTSSGPTQFSRAMDELGIQMMFALLPQAKGRVERTGETFQDRLVTELRLAGAASIGKPTAYWISSCHDSTGASACRRHTLSLEFRPLDPELSLEQVLCFKHSRRVARDNTVRFQLHTLQLLPGPERPSYAGTVVEVLEGLDRKLAVGHEGRIIPAQEAPPSPAFLRNGHGSSAGIPVPPSGSHVLGKRWSAALEPLDTGAEYEKDPAATTDSATVAGKPSAIATRKPTFLERERWKAIQKARSKGMSHRRIERELGIHRATIKRYLDSEGPPTGRAK